MGIEPRCCVIGVHVKGVIRQAGDGRAFELATQGEDQLVITERTEPSWPSQLEADLLLANVDVNYLPFDSLDPDRSEHVIQSNPNLTQVRLIVPNTDTMVSISID
jgi:hypothetical protein